MCLQSLHKQTFSLKVTSLVQIQTISKSDKKISIAVVQAGHRGQTQLSSRGSPKSPGPSSQLCGPGAYPQQFVFLWVETCFSLLEGGWHHSNVHWWHNSPAENAWKCSPSLKIVVSFAYEGGKTHVRSSVSLSASPPLGSRSSRALHCSFSLRRSRNYSIHSSCFITQYIWVKGHHLSRNVTYS